MCIRDSFQSIGMASKAIFLSVSRQVLILIPCLLILPQFYGQLGVWISMPVSYTHLFKPIKGVYMLFSQNRKQ